MLQDKHTPKTDEQIIEAFDEWVKNNPNGGVFECGGKTFRVTPKLKKS